LGVWVLAAATFPKQASGMAESDFRDLAGMPRTP
jgi:hypothetical protein